MLLVGVVEGLLEIGDYEYFMLGFKVIVCKILVLLYFEWYFNLGFIRVWFKNWLWINGGYFYI